MVGWCRDEVDDDWVWLLLLLGVRCLCVGGWFEVQACAML